MDETRDPGENGGNTVPESGPASEEAVPETRIRVRRREFFLFNTRTRFWRYILLMGAVSLVPSLVLAGLLAAAGVVNEATAPVFQPPEGVPEAVYRASLFFGFLCFAPIVETLLLVFTLWLFSFVTQSFTKRAIAAAVLWAVLHSIQAPAWGLVIWWPFFIFSCAYLSRRRVSWAHGYLAAALIHMIQNILPAVVVVATV